MADPAPVCSVCFVGQKLERKLQKKDEKHALLKEAPRGQPRSASSRKIRRLGSGTFFESVWPCSLTLCCLVKTREQKWLEVKEERSDGIIGASDYEVTDELRGLWQPLTLDRAYCTR